MRTLMIGLAATLVAVICWSILVAADKPPRKFGPEWTKNQDGTMHSRKLEIEVKRQTNHGNANTFYNLPTENYSVRVDEHDDKLGLGAHFALKGDNSTEFMSIDARTDQKGKVEEFNVVLKSVLYFDLDGDGMVDALCDNRGKHSIPMVIFEGQFIQVEPFTTGFATRKMWGLGRKVQYVFKGNNILDSPRLAP